MKVVIKERRAGWTIETVDFGGSLGIFDSAQDARAWAEQHGLEVVHVDNYIRDYVADCIK